MNVTPEATNDNAEGRKILSSMLADHDNDEQEKKETKEKQPETPEEKYTITQKDLGRKLTDIIYEIQFGESPELSEEQADMLHSLLIDRGYAEKKYFVGGEKNGVPVVFRSTTGGLSIVRHKYLAEVSKDANGQSITDGEWMLHNNIVAVASCLVSYNNKETCSPDDDFNGQKALMDRIHFVERMGGPVLDRMAELLNQFNDEITVLTSPKYIRNF